MCAVRTTVSTVRMSVKLIRFVKQLTMYTSVNDKIKEILDGVVICTKLDTYM